MTEEELVYFLKYHKNIEKSIEVTKRQLFHQIKDREDIIEHLSLIEYEKIGNHNNAKNYPDKIMEDIKKYGQIKENSKEDWKTISNILTAEKQCLNTIFTCIYQMKEPERSILILLYIENEKWDFICNELYISSTRLWRIRKEALKNLLNIYEASKKKKEIIEDGEKFLIQKFLNLLNEKVCALEVNWKELKEELHKKKRKD